MKLKKLITNVQQWSIDRGLDKADSKKQLLKLYEEFGELASGLAKGNKEVVKDSIGDVVVVLIILAQQQDIRQISDLCIIFDNLSTNNLMPRASELIGLISLRVRRKTEKTIEEYIVRLFSCLRTIAKRENLKFEDCLSQAWNEIKDRKGKLIDGVWVKEEDFKIKTRPAQKIDLSKINVGKINAANWPKLNNPFKEDKVNNPSHYKGKFGLEAIEVVRNFAGNLTAVQGFYWGNAIKYLLRFQGKNGLEDLKKARKNLDWLIEEMENDRD